MDQNLARDKRARSLLARNGALSEAAISVVALCAQSSPGRRHQMPDGRLSCSFSSRLLHPLHGRMTNNPHLTPSDLTPTSASLTMRDLASAVHVLALCGS